MREFAANFALLLMLVVAGIANAGICSTVMCSSLAGSWIGQFSLSLTTTAEGSTLTTDISGDIDMIIDDTGSFQIQIDAFDISLSFTFEGETFVTNAQCSGRQSGIFQSWPPDWGGFDSCTQTFPAPETQDVAVTSCTDGTPPLSFQVIGGEPFDVSFVPLSCECFTILDLPSLPGGQVTVSPLCRNLEPTLSPRPSAGSPSAPPTVDPTPSPLASADPPSATTDFPPTQSPTPIPTVGDTPPSVGTEDSPGAAPVNITPSPSESAAGSEPPTTASPSAPTLIIAEDDTSAAAISRNMISGVTIFIAALLLVV